MLTNSLVPETWELLARHEEDGRPLAYVVRFKHYGHGRSPDTIWKLVKYNDGWRSVSQWISQGRWRVFPEKRGVKLSDSKIDQRLLAIAEGR